MNVAAPISSRQTLPVAQRSLDALLEDLFGGLASMDGQTLYERIVKGCRRSAVALIRRERLTQEEADRIYDHLRAAWKGGPVRLEPVKPRELTGITHDVYQRLRDRGLPLPQVLVRLGTDVLSGHVMDRGDHLEIVTARTMLRVQDIQQAWKVVPETPIPGVAEHLANG